MTLEGGNDQALDGDPIAVILAMLRALPAADVQPLLDQVPVLEVVSGPVPTWLYLKLLESRPRALYKDGDLPVEVWAYGSAGEVLGPLTIWVEDGYLSAVEYAWVTNEPPTSWPATSALSLRI